jgi:hypothetical protein
VAAPACVVVGAALEAVQVAQGGVADEHHLSPTPPVAAVGPAARHLGFAAKAHAAVAPGPGLDVDARAIVHLLPS